MCSVEGNKSNFVYQFPNALDKNNNPGVIYPGIVVWDMGLGKRQQRPLGSSCILSQCIR